jgi:hypothetical protein
MNALVSELKEKKEDFEFYPTTDEIIFSIIKNIKKLQDDYNYSFNFHSILDIGAGSGKVLKAINKEFNVDLYAIEKADTLRDLLEQNVYIVGTDFNEQSLLDKTIDVTFCNPPYSEYEKWSKKIIRESCSPYIYLVIPTRWKESIVIKEAIKYRDAKFNIVGEYTFKEGERQARAIVNLIRIDLEKEKEDAFDRFFAEEFKELKDKFDSDEKESEYDYERKEKEKLKKFGTLVLGDSYLERIVQMYNEDIKKIKNNYLYVKKLEPELLKEFDIYPAKILSLLKDKLKNLKNLYWHELIGRMEEITERLISKKRQELLDTLNKNAHVDFTEGNIYAVVLWILKHAGQYIDGQLLEVYEEFISNANCKNYKSNQKVFEYDRWRYNEEKPSHVFLDFRLVVRYWGAIQLDWKGKDSEGRLTESACGHIRDLLTVANNLGFKCSTSDERLYHYSRDERWFPGQPQTFECWRKGKHITLFEVKAHKNGNLHVRLNQKFALALNVEYGRLKGWIHSGKQAAEELGDYKAPEYFKSNFTLLKSPFTMIEHKEEPKPEPDPEPKKENNAVLTGSEQLTLF